MRYVLSIILLLFASSSANAACDLSPSALSTGTGIESSQKCLINKLEELDAILKDVNGYTRDVKIKFENLLKEEAICQKIGLLIKENPSDIYHQGQLNGCQNLWSKRQKEYNDVMSEYIALKPEIKKLTAQQEALQLQYDLLESASDLLLNGAKK